MFTMAPRRLATMSVDRTGSASDIKTGLFVADVERDRRGSAVRRLDPAYGLAGGLDLEVGHEHVRSRTRERLRNGPADARPGACYQRALSRELEYHDVIFSRAVG
jgi:hypothetical protein